jgi:hypothetical protein
VRETWPRRTDFRDDLLRGIDAACGDLGEALHGVVVGHEQVGHLPIVWPR